MIKKSSVVKLISFLIMISAGFEAYGHGIINPSKGVWSNRQILVLDLPDGANAYYSVSGNDPESSGFAYDGPVLLDVEGDVYLRVAFIDKTGRKTTENLFYTVKDDPLPKDIDAYAFVENAVSNGLVDYTAGEVYSIPSSLEFYFGKEDERFEEGKELSIPSDTVLSRIVPCTVTDGNAKWRFVVRINPVMSGLFSRRNVPFVIENWDTIEFTNTRFIYKIDNQWWEQPKVPVTLDRSVSHMISWQQVDYSAENPVSFFVLPPKPQINEETDKNGSKYVYFSGEPGYKFGFIDEDGDVSELYQSLRFDTFQGDAFSGNMRTGIYFDSVYQGEINLDFQVNKQLPKKPLITSSAENGWARKLVTINIQKPDRTDLYVAVQGPVIVEAGSVSSDLLFNFMEKDFKLSKETKLILQPSNDGAVAYKVSSYVVDQNQNMSGVSEYSVIIDTTNYFVDEDTAKTLNVPSDGTQERPFASFEQLLPFINESRYVRLNVKGQMEMPNRRIILTSNIEINGEKNARINFPVNGSLVVRDSSLAVSDCLISYTTDKSQKEDIKALTSTLIQMEHGVLVLDNVELSGIFAKNGNLINSDNSVITVKNSGLTSTADSYTSVISSVDSKISIKNARITTVASTSVAFSCQGGTFELRKSNCSVVGVMGRVAELFDTHSSITNNSFIGQLRKTQGNGNPVYMDAQNLSVEDTGNTNAGF